MIPTALLPTFVDALRALAALPLDPRGTCLERDRDLRAQQVLHSLVVARLPRESVAVCVTDGAYPSGEVGASNSLYPNPLYAFGGLRFMCNKGHLGHVPLVASRPQRVPYALGDMVSGRWRSREAGRRRAFLETYPAGPRTGALKMLFLPSLSR